MCGVCGDVNKTVIIEAKIDCFKNWCCLPIPIICCWDCSSCEEKTQLEHYCPNCGACLAVVRKATKPDCCDPEFDREIPEHFLRRKAFEE